MSAAQRSTCGQCGVALGDLGQWSCPHCGGDLHIVGLIPPSKYRRRIRESFRVIVNRTCRKELANPECGRCHYPVRGMTAFECPECGADVRVVGAFVPECNLFSGVFLLLAIVALWTFVGLIGGLEFSLNLLRHYGPVDYSISVTLDGAISTRAWSKNPGGAPRLLVNSDMKLTGRIWDRKPLALSVVHFVLEPEFKDVSERPKVYLRYDLVSDELSWSNNSGTGGAIDDIRINEKLARQWLLLMVESPSDHQVTIVAKGVEHCVRHTVKSVRSHEKGKRVLGGGGGKQASSSSRGNYSIDSKVEYRWDGANPQSWQGIIQVMVFAIWLIGIAIILRIAFRRPKTD